ncbi:MAG: hypothetical protein Q7T90_11010, partial [Thiobacillus sp.]|nr:hypothetical protein [Thiobacillus sp.]
AASLGRKAAKPSDTDPSRPKYTDPLRQITDLAASRIITFFPRTIDEIGTLLTEEFDVLERSDKAEDLLEEERFGYHSVHYLVRLSTARTQLSEYERFRDAVIEVQVRTILQHSWAEIEHDIQYKSSAAIPSDIRRRFMALAGLLEIADREFQAIQDDDRALNAQAKSLVEAGKLGEVEITPSALRAYLQRKLGSDGRMSDWSYEWTVKLLKRLGFKNLDQVDACIRSYDDDRVSRLLSGNRQGQLTRFEYLLLASLGEKFIDRHVFAGQDWFGNGPRRHLKLLADAGMVPSGYDPLADVAPPIMHPTQPG